MADELENVPKNSAIYGKWNLIYNPEKILESEYEAGMVDEAIVNLSVWQEVKCQIGRHKLRN